MSFLKHSIRSHFTLQSLKPNHALPLLSLRQSPNHFSTESPQPPTQDDPSIDSLLEDQDKGAVFGRLFGSGLNRHTLKTDIKHLLGSNDLTSGDIRYAYSAEFIPTKVLIKFPSRFAFDGALGSILKNRLYRFVRAYRSEWEAISTIHDGKTLLLRGIPRTALPEDVERFLSGCEFDSSSIQMFLRGALSQPTRIALVQCPTEAEAMNALITKHRSFCLNNQITVQVLQ